jgi:hypothetical protein
MKKTLSAFSIVAALAAMPMTSNASNVGLSADIGTTGLGLHVTVPAMENVNARLGLNYLSYSYSGSTSQVDYDFKMKLNTFDALLDWHPMASGFRVSGGLVYNNNKIDATAKSNATGTYTIQGHTYTAADAGQINGSIDFRKVAPYVGIGWGNAISADKGWGFSADLGALIQGSPNTSLTNTGCNALAVSCAQLATDVAAENKSLDDKVSKFNVYPVVRVGLSYKF